MTALLILVFGGITLVMLYQTVAVFIGSREDQQRFEILDADLRLRNQLNARQARLIENLREIEIDRNLDKISQEDYAKHKRKNERETIRIKRQLEQLHGGQGWQERVDLARSKKAASQTKKRKLKKSKKKKTSALSCTACGHRITARDLFCSQCGHPTGT